jgi:predicted CoA-substrate-specific enzyme activase
MPEAVALGIDVGSRSMELVALDSAGNMVDMVRLATTVDPKAQLRRVLHGRTARAVTATGYGRDLVAQVFPGEVAAITEITAYALGAPLVRPGVRTILDMGGQDTKVVALSPEGHVLKFEMNDRCAAGTGKFLEHMATVFQMSVEEFGAFALKGQRPLPINSMCTVFAETEATSLMAQGNRPEDIALGLHAAIVRRTASMLRRVGLVVPWIFAGGVARNPCMVRMLEESLGVTAWVPADPDTVGALGAARHAWLRVSP